MRQLSLVRRLAIVGAATVMMAACASTPKQAPCPVCPAPTPAAPLAPTLVNDQGDAKTITLVVKWKLKAEYEQEALAYLADFIKKARDNEPGTVLYVVTKDPKEERTYYWIERYRDRAALEFHRGTDYRNTALKLLPKWLEKFPPELFLELEQVIPS